MREILYRTSLAYSYPALIKEWHPTKNGDKTPWNVSYGSGYKAWWIYSYDDAKTGKHFDFEWQAAVYHRITGEGCPYLAGKRVYPGFNDLGTLDSELGKQVHPFKNHGQTAKDIIGYSNKKIWWLYPYDDPKTNRHFDFEWEATPASRLNSRGCPFLSNQRIWPGFNDLKTTFPDLAKEWCYEKNGDLKPESFMPNSRKNVWWKYLYDDPKTGKHIDFIWQAKITNRVQGDNCPFLSGNRIWPGYNDISTKRPDLVNEWDYEKNRNGTPETISLYSNKKRWWKCSNCGMLWYASPAKRACGQDCRCRN